METPGSETRRVVVLGGTGFIGSHFLRSLSGSTRTLSISRHLPLMPAPGVEYITGDLRDQDLLSRILNPGDVVVHLACSSTPLSSEHDGEREIARQVQDMSLLTEILAAKVGAHLIFASSGGTVYGDHGRMHSTEETATIPLSVHGKMKLAVERAIMQAGKDLGVTYTILRPGNIYGRNPDPSRAQGLLEVAFARTREGLPVDVWGDGSIARDYLYIDDMTELLRSLVVTKNAGIFNVGTGVSVSVHDALGVLGEVLGSPVVIRHHEGRDFDIPFVALDSSKIMRETGWYPRHDLRGGLSAYYRRLQQL